jgi:hypothetical protein
VSTPGLPELPTRQSLARKVDAYRRNADAHRRGEHKTRDVKLCKACGERRRARA